MEMRALTLALSLVAAGCATTGFAKDQIKNIYVADFESEDQDMCDATDVPIEYPQAVKFFKRAKVITYHEYEQNYPNLPCKVVGTLQYRGKPCNWEISLARTGVITCGKQETYLVCEDCKDLFTPERPCPKPEN